MATVYDEFLGSRGNLSYVENAAMEYPTPEDNTVLGTTFLPRVYGKDLTAFEIASSGIVTVSLDDVRSLDLTRASAESNVILSTLCNDSFEINVNSDAVTVKADGVNNDLSIFTERDINGAADRSINLSAQSNVFVVGQSDVDIVASNNASVKVANELLMESTAMSNLVSGEYNTQVGGEMKIGVSNDLTIEGLMSWSNKFLDSVFIQAGQNATVTADNHAKIVAINRVELSGVETAMNLIMDDESQVFRTHTDFEYFATASNKFEINTSNNFVLVAKDEINMSSTTMSNAVSEDYKTDVGRDMDVTVADQLSLSSTTMSNVVSQDYKTTVGNDMVVTVDSNLDLSSHTMSNAVTEDYKTTVGRDMEVTVTDDLTITTTNTSNVATGDYSTEVTNDMKTVVGQNADVEVQNGTYDLSVHDAAMTLVMDHTSDTVSLETKNDLAFGASNDMTTTVLRDMVTNVTRDILMTSTTMSNTTSEDYKTTVGRDMDVTVDQQLSLSSTTMSNVVSEDYKTQVLRDMVVDVASNLDITVQDGSYDLSVNGGAMTMSLDAATNNFVSHATNDYIVTSSNDTTIDTKLDMLVRSKDSDNDRMHTMKFLSDNKIKFTTTGTYDFAVADGINDTPRTILGMDNSNVFVYGNLNVEGVVNSTSVIENKLEVQDKMVMLATNSNFLDSMDGPEEDILYEDDGVVNDGAGLKIHGFPEGAVIPEGSTKHAVADLYEKSLRWNHRTTGVLGVGGDEPENEARWEFRGGSLFLTNKRLDEQGNLVNTCSFGFRINSKDQLELIKEVNPVEGQSFMRRVAKFGFNL